jgi:hypothetical protein
MASPLNIGKGSVEMESNILAKNRAKIALFFVA